MYNKLFTKVLDSSIWLEDHPTRIVWITFLAAMDQDGMCNFASVVNLARRAIVTTEEARRAVGFLEAPDPDSSDPDNEGRRIERVPGGWIVLNSIKYRERVTSHESRRLARERAQRYRDKKNGVTPKRYEMANVTPASRDDAKSNGAVTQAEAEAYTEAASTLASTAVAVPAATVFELPLPGDQGEWNVPQKLYDEMQKAYPDLNIMGELSEMRAWLITNNRKTASGLPRFVNNWLSKSQNKPRGQKHGSSIAANKSHQRTTANMEAFASIYGIGHAQVDIGGPVLAGRVPASVVGPGDYEALHGAAHG